VGDTFTVEVPSGGGALSGRELLKTGQTTSYRTGDDGDLQEGRDVDFLTLDYTNPFGNTNRFTDELGGTTYANDIVIDWSTYNAVTGKVLGYRRTFNGVTLSWNDATDGALAVSIGTFTSGWRLPNFNELNNIINWSLTSRINYAPFNIGGTWELWTSNTPAGTTANAQTISHSSYLQRAKTNTLLVQYLPVRTFTVTGTTLT
jgi:hypothetical protein